MVFYCDESRLCSKIFFRIIQFSFTFSFVKSIKVFGEGSNANYLLKGFRHYIHRGGFPDGIFSKAATKILVGYDNFYAPGTGKYKDFRFYYEVNLKLILKMNRIN